MRTIGNAVLLKQHASPLVFITGASSGLGQALATYYSAQGWRLALVARRYELMQKWCAELGLKDQQCYLFEGDVSQPDEMRAIAEKCVRNHGLPQVVIANAGISQGSKAERGSLESMEAIWKTNSFGMAATFKPFLQGMHERGHGTLVGVASMAGIRGFPKHSAYCSSKSAAITYCESLRVELRRSGIKVVTICPGFVATEMTRDNQFPMPFLMTADNFARLAYKAIKNQRSYIIIPWQMGWLAKILRFLPNWLFDRWAAGQVNDTNEENKS